VDTQKKQKTTWFFKKIADNQVKENGRGRRRRKERYPSCSALRERKYRSRCSVRLLREQRESLKASKLGDEASEEREGRSGIRVCGGFGVEHPLSYCNLSRVRSGPGAQKKMMKGGQRGREILLVAPVWEGINLNLFALGKRKENLSVGLAAAIQKRQV